jgi:hypothetical protein
VFCPEIRVARPFPHVANSVESRAHMSATEPGAEAMPAFMQKLEKKDSEKKKYGPDEQKEEDFFIHCLL